MLFVGEIYVLPYDAKPQRNMKSFSLLLTLFLVGGTLCAEQIFILFDGSCGNRIRYEQAIAQQPRTDYYAYQYDINTNTKLILETGTESGVTQSYLPQGYIYCGDPRLSLQLADRVNSGADRVFILLPTGNQRYVVQPVVMAAVLERMGPDLTYQSPLTGFQFNSDNAIIGVNLAYNNPNAKVFFEGRDNNACNGVYLFRQLNPDSGYPIIDYRVVPEIGVTERRLGSDGRTTSGGAIVAREVNGQPVQQYLAAICASATALASGQPIRNIAKPTDPTNYSSGVTIGQPYTPPSSQTQPQAYNGDASNPTTATHTVAKGETLYSISRRYDTSVDAIKANNGLTSNTVFPGQQLAIVTTVSNGPATVSIPPTTNPTVPTRPYNPGAIASSNVGADAPTPYNTPTTAAPQAYNTTGGTRGQTAVYGEDTHIVQPGETVASVALKYGFTSAKFREMNDMGPNEVLKVGQRLTTSDCNCPPQQPAPTAEPQSTPATQPAAPPTYGVRPATPQAYGTIPVTPQAYGTPTAAAVPTYRAPVNAPAATQPKSATVIDNRLDFGAPPSASLSTLESNKGQAPSAPRAYGSYQAPTQAPAPAPVASPRSNNSFGAPQPSTYGSAPAPGSYGGTPIGADIDYSQPNAPSDRAFHLVQEGESLYTIARRYGMTVEELRALNALAPADVIVPFQKLYVN